MGEVAKHQSTNQTHPTVNGKNEVTAKNGAQGQAPDEAQGRKRDALTGHSAIRA